MEVNEDLVIIKQIRIRKEKLIKDEGTNKRIHKGRSGVVKDAKKGIKGENNGRSEGWKET